MKKLVAFICGSLAFGLLALSIGYFAGSTDAWIQGGMAFALAFIPAVLTMAWCVFSYRSAPADMQLAALGGSGVRMAVALGGGYLLTNVQPQLFDTAFWAWLVLFYLTMLAFEIALLVRQEPKSNGSPQT